MSLIEAVRKPMRILDRQSNAYQNHAEYRGLAGMPGIDRALFEKPSDLPVALAPGEVVGIPVAIVPEK